MDGNDLSRREREVLGLIFEMESATSGQIRDRLENAPGGNAVRTTLQILENKGLIARDGKQGREFVYRATEQRGSAGARALENVLSTFFQGSLATAASCLAERESLDDQEYDRLRRLIENNSPEAKEL